MNYLAAAELEAYGLEAETAENWIAAASALLDAHCRRATLGVHEYVERIQLADGCNRARLTFLPLAIADNGTTALVKVRARYGCARRGDAGRDLANDFATAFFLPRSWVELDPAAIDACAKTGELTLPMHPLGLQANELEVTYTAGLDPLPESVKIACAQLVRNAQATPALNVRSSGVDRMHMEYFSDSLLDSAVRKLLAPYVAQKVG